MDALCHHPALAGYPAFQLCWKSDAPAPGQCHTRLGTGAQGAPLTWSLPSKEHTGSSCALPAGLASAPTVPLAPSFCHPRPSVPCRQPGAAPAWRHLWCSAGLGCKVPSMYLGESRETKNGKERQWETALGKVPVPQTHPLARHQGFALHPPAGQGEDTAHSAPTVLPPQEKVPVA